MLLKKKTFLVVCKLFDVIGYDVIMIVDIGMYKYIIYYKLFAFLKIMFVHELVVIQSYNFIF